MTLIAVSVTTGSVSAQNASNQVNQAQEGTGAAMNNTGEAAGNASQGAGAAMNNTGEALSNATGNIMEGAKSLFGGGNEQK